MHKKQHTLVLLAWMGMLTLGLVDFRDSVLTPIGEYLITEHPLEKTDAIILLGGSIADRTLEAVDIYKNGYAPLIVFTMGPEPDGYEELVNLGIKIPEGHDLTRLIALKLGVPEPALVLVDKRAESTYSEMEIIYDHFLKENNIKSVILVTSKYHTTRATMIFNDVTNGQIKVITRPSKYDSFDPEHWWSEREYRRQTVFEYLKFLHHYIFDAGAGKH